MNFKINQIAILMTMLCSFSVVARDISVKSEKYNLLRVNRNLQVEEETGTIFVPDTFDHSDTSDSIDSTDSSEEFADTMEPSLPAKSEPRDTLESSVLGVLRILGTEDLLSFAQPILWIQVIIRLALNTFDYTDTSDSIYSSDEFTDTMEPSETLEPSILGFRWNRVLCGTFHFYRTDTLDSSDSSRIEEFTDTMEPYDHTEFPVTSEPIDTSETSALGMRLTPKRIRGSTLESKTF